MLVYRLPHGTRYIVDCLTSPESRGKDAMATKATKRIHKITLKQMFDESPDTSYLGEYSNSPSSEFSIDRMHDLDCPVQTYNRVLADYVGTHEFNPEVQASEYASTHNIDIEYARSTNGTCADCGASVDECIASPCKHYKTDVCINCDIQKEECKSEVCDYYYDACTCGGGRSSDREYRYFNPSFNYVDKNGEAKDLTREDVIKYTRQDYERMESLNSGSWCYIGIMAEAEVVTNIAHNGSGVVQTIGSGGLWGIESDSDKDYLESVRKEELDALRTELEAIGFSKRAVSAAFRNVEQSGDAN